MENAGIDCWYAVCCKPRQEGVAEENLQRQGFHGYLPRIRIRQRRRGHWIDAVEVLFPRYIFIRLDPLRRSTATVRSTRGVVGLVRFGGQPAVVLNLLVIGKHPSQSKYTRTLPCGIRKYRGRKYAQCAECPPGMAHGYFNLNLDIVGDTVQQHLPDLEAQRVRIE